MNKKILPQAYTKEVREPLHQVGLKEGSDKSSKKIFTKGISFVFMIMVMVLVLSLSIVSAKNFNITSNGNNLMFVNGTSGNTQFGFNVSASYFSGDGSGLTGLNLTGVSGSSQWTTTGSDISVSDSLFIGNLNISTELNGEVNVW